MVLPLPFRIRVHLDISALCRWVCMIVPPWLLDHGYCECVYWLLNNWHACLCTLPPALQAGGDLRTALSRRREEFKWTGRGRAIAMDLARGLHYLHRRWVGGWGV